MVVTTVVTTATTAGTYAALGGVIVFLLLAALVARQIAGQAPLPRASAVQRVLLIAVVPLAASAAFVLLHAFLAVA